MLTFIGKSILDLLKNCGKKREKKWEIGRTKKKSSFSLRIEGRREKKKIVADLRKAKRNSMEGSQQFVYISDVKLWLNFSNKIKAACSKSLSDRTIFKVKPVEMNVS